MARLSDGDIARLRAVISPPSEPEPQNWLEQAEHRLITVHTVDDRSYEGILHGTFADGVLLWKVRLLTSPAPVEIAGEVFIPREKVLLVQTVRM